MRLGILLLVAYVAFGGAMFGLGYMLHRPTHHRTRIDLVYDYCQKHHAKARMDVSTCAVIEFGRLP